MLDHHCLVIKVLTDYNPGSRQFRGTSWSVLQSVGDTFQIGRTLWRLPCDEEFRIGGELAFGTAGSRRGFSTDQSGCGLVSSELVRGQTTVLAEIVRGRILNGQSTDGTDLDIYECDTEK